MSKRIFLFLIAVILATPVGARAQTSCALESGHAYKTAQSNAVWYVSTDCKKRPIKNPDVFFSHFSSWRDVELTTRERLTEVPNHDLGFLPWGVRREFKNGSLVKTVDDPKVYVIIDGERYPIENEKAFQELGYSFSQIEDVVADVLHRVVLKRAIRTIDDYPASLIFAVGNGKDLYLLERDENGNVAKRHIENFEDVKNAYRADRIARLPATVRIDDSASGEIRAGINLRRLGRVAQIRLRNANSEVNDITTDHANTRNAETDTSTPSHEETPNNTNNNDTIIADPFITRGSSLGLLSDEFSGDNLSSWRRAYQDEGWGFDQLEEFAVGSRRSGWLTMIPYASSWYQDYRGIHVFKRVEGDFIATTRISVRNRAGNGAPGALYSLAGIFVREPRNITPDTWVAGEENYVFLSLGAADQAGTYQTEVKTTVNSNSQLEIGPANNGDATIRVVRIGAHMIMMIRPDGGSWRVHKRYDRPNFSSTLNVGLTAYTDWPSAERIGVDLHNRNRITDGNPDLRVDIDYFHFARPSLPESVYNRLLTNPWSVNDSELLTHFSA